jgi:hypothetical protein
VSAVHPDEVVAAVPLEYLPWHASARARLTGAIAGGRMPHALLLHGAEGLGKERFATTLAAGLLCTRPGPELMPCGGCADCGADPGLCSSGQRYGKAPHPPGVVGDTCGGS